MGMLELFQNYMGTGMVLIWYLAALIYLALREKRRDKRVLFLYVPVIILILFFNPVFFKLFSILLEEVIYYRLIWLLPVTVTLAYAIVRICGELKGRQRILFGVIAAVLVMTTGTLVYSSPVFRRAENLHQVPQEIVEICDRIVIPGREVRAAFPREFLHYVRQYSPRVCMPYGREVLLGTYNELDYILRFPTIDVRWMAQTAKEEKCHYIIFSEDKVLSEKMEDYDYELFGQVGSYLIYKDITMDFSEVY